MKALPLIHTSWLKPFADYFAKRKINLRPYYEEAQIEEGMVTSGEGWITKHQLYTFLNSLAEGESMPEVGFVVGETITPDKLGGLGQAMAQAETLADVIQAFCLLINRHVEENRCWLEEGELGEVWFFNQKAPTFVADRSIADHAGLMSMVNLARLVGGEDWYPQRMNFQTGKVSVHKKIRGLNHTEIMFDQAAAGFTFPAKWLLCPIQFRGTSPPADPSPDGLLEDNETLVAKLRRLLRDIMGVGGICPSVNLMAKLCGTSTRTLHRRLQNRGVSYRHLLDEVRLELARAQLRDTDIPVKELAFELGYSGANNFIRAFKRMSGTTPEAFRQGSAAVPRPR
ncbi:MAG: helix-turn-helix domain-containing protein [Verrucomicrobiales bacterium]